MSHCGVFLDRDGTINQEVTYLAATDQLQLIDGAALGVRSLNLAGYKVVVITNQSAVARGYLSEETLQDIHRFLQDELRIHDATLDAIYYCPHHPTEGMPPYRGECQCRKPKPGMLHRAAEELDIDLSRSFVVGDKLIDLDLGSRVGCTTVLVRTGYGCEVEKDLDRQPVQPDFVANDLQEASAWIVEQPSRR
ncbi:MAG: D-glycero-beta-D-manno-heptose 1,7-bisphosphate 7-phosphatase [Pirellulaceae bacterium]